MGLIELCFVSLLSPQDPVPAPPPAPPAEAPAAQHPAPPADPQPTAETPATTSAAPIEAAGDDRATLAAAEQAGKNADGSVLLALTHSVDAAVAARAAFVLGHSGNPSHATLLGEVVTSSPHADARAQAMQVLLTRGDATTLLLAVDALGDGDRRVRTLAVQLLGKLRRPDAIEPLLALIDTQANGAEPGPPTDVQEALVRLADFTATPHLLRVATAINDGDITGTGDALTFLFQTLSPQLARDDETTALVAVLAHREKLLRRYAITRLTELGSPSAAAALEGRLAAEGAELRPLIEVALAQLRRDREPAPHDEVHRAKQNALLLWARAQHAWRALSPLQQGAIASGSVLALLLVWMWRRAARRERRAAEAAATLAMVQPSDDYEAAQYEEDGEGDYEYEEYATGDEPAGQDDWEQEDDDEAAMLAGGGGRSRAPRR